MRRLDPSMKSIPLKALKAVSKYRPKGYYKEVLSMGKSYRGTLEISDEYYNFLKKKYAGYPNPSYPLIFASEPRWKLTLKNLFYSMIEWMFAGFSLVTNSLYRTRLSICKKCDRWNPKMIFRLGGCSACNCPRWKLRVSTAKCPHPMGGKW